MGLQSSLVRRLVPPAAADISTGLFLARPTFTAAMDVALEATSVMASTFCMSNHSRALVDAMSGLFWWSA